MKFVQMLSEIVASVVLFVAVGERARITTRGYMLFLQVPHESSFTLAFLVARAVPETRQRRRATRLATKRKIELGEITQVPMQGSMVGALSYLDAWE